MNISNDVRCFPFMPQMRNHCPHALQSGDRSPCKDPTNTPTQETANQADSSSSLHVPRTPLSNIANSNTTGSFFIFTCCNFNILTTISIFYATLLYQLLMIIRSNFFFHLEYHKGLEYLDYEYPCPDIKEYGIVPDSVILQLN